MIVLPDILCKLAVASVVSFVAIGLVADDAQCADADAVEIEFWQSVKETSEAAELELYLEQYPDGTFSSLARMRLERLVGDKSAVSVSGKQSKASSARDASPGGSEVLDDKGSLVIPPAPAARAEGVLGVRTARANEADPVVVGSVPQQGVAVIGVEPDSPADKAGFRKNDIILSVDGIKLEDAAQLSTATRSLAPGKVVTFAIVRDRQPLSISVEIGDKFQLVWRLAHMGSGEHMLAIAEAYADGILIARDDREAAKWYERAAGVGEIRAIDSLGYLYQTGRGVDQDYAKAVSYLRRAANAGIPNAMNTIGNHYEMGWGIEQDIAAAALWYERSALEGNKLAMYNLGNLYYSHEQFSKKKSEGFSWIRKSGDKGVRVAHAFLGQAYEYGIGVAKDIDRAAQNYQVGADLGEPQAQYQLALLYYNGNGVPKDRARSIKLMRSAAASEWPLAIETLKNLRVPLYDQRELQELLAKAGFDPGPVDGQPGKKTKAAIRSFQKANRLETDGQASLALLARLRKAVSKAPPLPDENAGAETPDIGNLGDLELLN